MKYTDVDVDSIALNNSHFSVHYCISFHQNTINHIFLVTSYFRPFVAEVMNNAGWILLAAFFFCLVK